MQLSVFVDKCSYILKIADDWLWQISYPIMEIWHRTKTVTLNSFSTLFNGKSQPNIMDLQPNWLRKKPQNKQHQPPSSKRKVWQTKQDNIPPKKVSDRTFRTNKIFPTNILQWNQPQKIKRCEKYRVLAISTLSLITHTRTADYSVSNHFISAFFFF